MLCQWNRISFLQFLSLLCFGHKRMKDLRQNGKGRLAQNPEVSPATTAFPPGHRGHFQGEELRTEGGRLNLQQALVPGAESRDKVCRTPPSGAVSKERLWDCTTSGGWSRVDTHGQGHLWGQSTRLSLYDQNWLFLKQKIKIMKLLLTGYFLQFTKTPQLHYRQFKQYKKMVEKTPPLIFLLPEITTAEILETIKDHHSKTLRYTCI